MNDFIVNPARIVPASHPLHNLAVYLARLQAARPFPRPREFDILACRTCVGWVHLADVIVGSEPPDCFFTVYGSQVADIVENDYQGRRASDITDKGRREHWFELLNRALDRRAPEFTHDVTRGPIRFGASRTFDRLVWPMSNDGETIGRILIGIQPT